MKGYSLQIGGETSAVDMQALNLCICIGTIARDLIYNPSKMGLQVFKHIT